MWDRAMRAGSEGYANMRHRMTPREPALADEGTTHRPVEDELDTPWTLVEQPSAVWKLLVWIAGLGFGYAVPPITTSIASFGIADRPPALFAIPCILSTPAYFLCDHHTFVLAVSWILQTFLYMDPEYAMVTGPLLALLSICFISQSYGWEPFESDDRVSLRRIMATVEQYGLNPLSTLYRQLRIAAVLLAVAQFVARFGLTWRNLRQAVVGSEHQFPWCFVMIILGMIFSFGTWSCWAKYALWTDAGSSSSVIFGLMVLGHIFLRQLPAERFRDQALDRKMQYSRMVMIGHFFSLVMIYQAKWWMLPRITWLSITFTNVVYFGLLVGMNSRDIGQRITSFVGGPEQDTPEVMRFARFPQQEYSRQYFNPVSQ